LFLKIGCVENDMLGDMKLRRATHQHTGHRCAVFFGDAGGKQARA
jgi:hypothetical protein